MICLIIKQVETGASHGEKKSLGEQIRIEINQLQALKEPRERGNNGT